MAKGFCYLQLPYFFSVSFPTLIPFAAALSSLLLSQLVILDDHRTIVVAAAVSTTQTAKTNNDIVRVSFNNSQVELSSPSNLFQLKYDVNSHQPSFPSNSKVQVVSKLNSNLINQTEHPQQQDELTTVKATLDTIAYVQVPFELSIVIRVGIFIYCCLVIGYLCDEYFVPSLEHIGKALTLPTDLIAALLIPFGTSGPEIFSSAVGVFFAQNDIGTGAIIGSAVFNLLAIPAASGIAAGCFLGRSIELQELPILRDLLFYIISIIVLILTIKDNAIDLLESSLFMLLFVLYIGVILYNAKLLKNVDTDFDNGESLPLSMTKVCNNNNNKQLTTTTTTTTTSTTSYNTNDSIVTINNRCIVPTKEQPKCNTNTETVNKHKSNKTYKMKEYLNKCNEIMSGDKESIMDKVSKLCMQTEDQNQKVYERNEHREVSHVSTGEKPFLDLEAKLNAFVEEIISKKDNHKLDRSVRCKKGYEKLHDEEENSSSFSDNFFLNCLLMPFSIIFRYTMPITFIYVTFLLSICWLSLLSYLTVWSISGLSDMLGIPPSLSGMTILAAGSAVPDLVTTIVMIKKRGIASMGISAAFASNIFSILLGLGLPWIIRIVMIWCQTGQYVSANIILESDTLPYTSVLLLFTICALYLTFRVCKWKISKQFSLICFIIHVLFIALNISFEFLFAN